MSLLIYLITTSKNSLDIIVVRKISDRVFNRLGNFQDLRNVKSKMIANADLHILTNNVCGIGCCDSSKNIDRIRIIRFSIADLQQAKFLIITNA